MPKKLPRKVLDKYLACRAEEGVSLFCLIVPNKIPQWLSIFINEHERTGDILVYPEFNKTINQQTSFMTNFLKDSDGKIRFIVTQSPWIISDFDRKSVLIIEGSKVEPPRDQTLGASVNMITITILGRRMTCGDRAISIMKRIQKRIRLIKDPVKLNKIIDDEIYGTLGDSIEKQMLVSSILNRIKDLEKNNKK